MTIFPDEFKLYIFSPLWAEKCNPKTVFGHIMDMIIYYKASTLFFVNSISSYCMKFLLPAEHPFIDFTAIEQLLDDEVYKDLTGEALRQYEFLSMLDCHCLPPPVIVL